ncbi:MAG: hypothetical protein GXP62_15315 [Oligoflexia bacterium]|nr:hypothetical protein [Oligoflexia bacterium]
MTTTSGPVRTQAFTCLALLWGLLTASACAHRAAHGPISTRLTAEEDGLRGELVTQGSAAGRAVADDGADLILLYGGEEAGVLGPCGCKVRPRGGLARVAAYRDAVRAASAEVPVLLLQTGSWLDPGTALDGAPRADASQRNAWMVRGLDALHPDAVNLANGDMLALRQVDASALPLLSANLRHDGVAPWIQIDTGDLVVGITGIAAPGPDWMTPSGWTSAQPVDAARAVIAAHAQDVDLVVLLSLAAPDAARSLAQQGLVDVVIDANAHRDFTAPFRVGDAVWVRSHDQTMRLGELRLHVEDGRVSQGWDRKIDLDETLKPEPHLQQVTRQAEVAIASSQRALSGRR